MAESRRIKSESTSSAGTNRRQFRFLLRSSALSLVMLALWWWLLLNPLLGLLRVSADFALRLAAGQLLTPHVVVDAGGSWTLQLPLPGAIARMDAIQRLFSQNAPAGGPVRVRSLKITIEKARNPILFTLGFPLYWAIVIAAPRSPRFWRIFLGGTACLWLMAVISLLFYAAYTVGGQFHLIPNSFAGYLMHLVEYLIISVLPYLAPLLIALACHSELRWMIVTWNGGNAEPAGAAGAQLPASRSRTRRRSAGR